MDGSAATLALLLDWVIEGTASRPDAETTGAILSEAERFAARYLTLLATTADCEEARLQDGCVRTALSHAEAWRACAEDGWIALTAPEAAGGQASPMALATPMQEIFDAACPAFGMLPVKARCATRLLERHGIRRRAPLLAAHRRRDDLDATFGAVYPRGQER